MKRVEITARCLDPECGLSISWITNIEDDEFACDHPGNACMESLRDLAGYCPPMPIDGTAITKINGIPIAELIQPAQTR